MGTTQMGHGHGHGRRHGCDGIGRMAGLARGVAAGVVALSLALGASGCARIDLSGLNHDDGYEEETRPDGSGGKEITRKDLQPTSEETGSDGSVEVVPTAYGTLGNGNTVWCSTMQMCWNVLMDDLNGGEPVLFLDPSMQEDEDIAALNARLFDASSVSDDSVCSYIGPMTYDAQAEIVSDVTETLETYPDVIDQLRGWQESEEGADWLIYTILYRPFVFATPFEDLGSNGVFGDDGDITAGVRYFSATDDDMREQITPLYYDEGNDETDGEGAVASYAISIETEDGDTLVLVRNPEGDTLREMWENARARADEAEGDETAPLTSADSFTCPYLSLDELCSYDEWVNQPFCLTDEAGTAYEHEFGQALQSVSLSLTNEGGEVRSEAALTLTKSAPRTGNGGDDGRDFRFDGTFALFVVDSNAPDGGEEPYLALLVRDISAFQRLS